MNLFLLRGLPGSGKSTIAKLLSENGQYPIYSVDDFFTNSETGEYSFQFDQNHLAYKQCEANVEGSMLNGERKIFVHNTFTIDWEIEAYFKLAAKYHYQVHVLTVENCHGSANNHGVSEEQILKMAVKYKVKLF